MIHVAIVEDNLMTRDYLVNNIPWNLCGVEVTASAANGLEALELFEQDIPDLLITDIKMPLMNGIALIQEIVRRGYSPKTILLTAYDDFSYAQAAIKSGAFDYILKPIDDQLLLDAVRQAVERINRERETMRQSEWIGQIWDISAERRMEGADDPIRKALQYIGSNFEQKLSLEMVAEHIGYNPCYFSHMLKKTLGCSFPSFLKQLRIEKACALLTGTGLPISEIAERTGFVSTQYFTLQFNQMHGKSPSQYRREHMTISGDHSAQR